MVTYMYIITKMCFDQILEDISLTSMLYLWKLNTHVFNFPE